MKKLRLLSLATSALLNIAPAAQACANHQKHPTAQVAWTTAENKTRQRLRDETRERPRFDKYNAASSRITGEDAGLFRSGAERTMNNPG